MLLTELFARTVATTPDAVAIDVPPGLDGRPRQLATYRELASSAAAVAAWLAPHVHDEALVVVLLPRPTPWAFAAQLGVLQAGAAHVCIDPSFPAAHLQHVARDAQAVAIVTDAAGAGRVQGLGLPVLVVPPSRPPAGWPAPEPGRGSAPTWLQPQSLAYAIYTSGTTGAPKAVLLEHAGACNLITRGVSRFGLRAGDRIAQGSSLAYDSSIEETWLALASGATVVVLDDETVRSGPDLAAWLRRERVTVFCPPPTLLRAMDVRSPRDELPDLRLCYVGGEALPEDLAATWGAALWLENGYGPTECTVTVVRGRVTPGQPVTIGTPVPPHQAHVLDHDLRPVAAGEAGELCIAGPGLARGYLGQPELTAARFPTLPGLGRVYRTGDLVTVLSGGELAYHGRIDAQVKLRGYRIELEAIEAVLARCDGVREVACRVQGDDAAKCLAAHVVPADPTRPPDPVQLARAVGAVLPEYMVPKHFANLATLPRSVGGKVDRKRLPVVAAAPSAPGSDREDAVAASGWADRSPAAQALRLAAAAVLGLDAATLGPEQDFFALGGDSLRAAILVSRLRRLPGGAGIAVRDVYVARTLGALAQRLDRVADPTGPDGAGADAAGSAATVPLVGVARPGLATAVQVGFLLALLLGFSALAYGIGFLILPALLSSFSLSALVLLGPWFAAAGLAAWTLATLWVAVIGKELLVGRYQPLRTPAWSGFHVRHWIVVRLVRLVPWNLLEGTEAKNVALRALGARIGKRVHIHRGVDVLSGGWDLLELGDDTTLQREAQLGLCELDRGHLVVGSVRLEPGATLATRAGTGPDVVIGAGAIVQPLAYVDAGQRVPAGARWSGVPAGPVGPAAPPAAISVDGLALSPWLYTTLLLLLRFTQAPLLALPFTALAWLLLRWVDADARAVLAWLCGTGPTSQPLWFAVAVAAAVVALPVALVAQALVLRWSPAVPAGTHARWSWLHLQLQVRTELVEAAGTWLSGTLFWPWWLRVAGMRLGRDCEVSTILDVLPEHVAIGGGSFLADGVYLGVPWHHGGRVTVAPTSLGERTFVGNHVVVPAGERLPDDLVLGVSTVADGATMQADTGWFGLPAFRLPRREVVRVDPQLTHQPGLLRYSNRVFWEGLRVVLPALPVALGLWWFDVVAIAHPQGWMQGTAIAAVASFGVAATLALVVLALKWLLLGRVRPGQHGLWSCWASRWDFHYVVWQRYGRALLQPLEGTLLLPWYLRAMGMRIGRRCVLGDGFAQVVDPDMLTLEDGATVHALFQAHSFEDRVLKIDRVRIGRDATVGHGTVVLYGADIGDGAHVLPHGVVMKREALLPGRNYAGAPTAEVAGPQPTVPAGVAAPASVAGPQPTSPEEADGVAFDVARGAAVLGMIWLHFVPEVGDGAAGLLAALGDASVRWLEGIPAATFVLLAGMAWGRHGVVDTFGNTVQLGSRWVRRRALGLVALGLPFWCWCWPNDVMVPIALMLLATAALLQRGRGPTVVAIGALLAAAPVLGTIAAEITAADWRDDGTHAANHGIGWATLRWYTFDGTYPLLPWLALPLLGALLAIGGRSDPSRWRRWAWAALPLPFLAHGVDHFATLHADVLGDAAAPLSIQWQPTSLAFLLRNGGIAVAIVALLSWWSMRRGMPRWLAWLAPFGRASLTHYVGHIVLVYAPMRWWWPDEDWSVGIGAGVAVGYVAVAVPLSWWLHRRGCRGPLEQALSLWARG